MSATTNRLLMPTEAPAGAVLVKLTGHRCLIVDVAEGQWRGAYYWPTEDGPTVRKIERTAEAGNAAARARLAGMPMQRAAGAAPDLVQLLWLVMPGDDLRRERRELELYLGMHRKLTVAA